MKRATVRTEHDRPELVAAAIAPDNTDEMSTRVEADADRTRGTVVTTIERETTGGLRTTADDYVTNLIVAQQLIDTTTQS
jgi:tRNA threonylcarbamoyladenosine modification (KEOPS) complex  Pcc1 subunit